MRRYIYPRLLDATGRCPPEDVGGPWGYAEFIEALADPKHERHAEMRDWAGDFAPLHLDPLELADCVATLARQWARKPATRRAKTS